MICSLNAAYSQVFDFVIVDVLDEKIKDCIGLTKEELIHKLIYDYNIYNGYKEVRIKRIKRETHPELFI